VNALNAYSEWRRRRRPYDHGWLTDLAREQHPDKPWLAESLARCTRARHESDVYLRFVSSFRANKPGSAWQFVENITLEHEVEGTLVLDILTHQRVGGVEFLSRLLRAHAA
jgi:hypothetical protein